MKEISGSLSAEGKNFAIVAARFNSLITERLVKGAQEAIVAHGGTEATVAWVPGSMELAVVAKHLIRTKQFHAVICLGAVIKGDTDHYDYVAGNAAAAIARLSSESGIPVLFGVLTTDTVEQALNRAGIKHGNAGYAAAVAAIETASVCEKIASL